ncbi:MAG: hypothetical protein WCP97_01865 [bacterium]
MKKLKFLGIFTTLLLLGTAALAYQPVFLQNETNNVFESASVIDNPAESKITYGRLNTAGEVDFYKFTVNEKIAFPIKLLVPYNDKFADFNPSLVVFGKDFSAVPTKLPFTYPTDYKAIPAKSPSEASRSVYYDKLLMEYFFSGPEAMVDFNPNTDYLVAVYDPQKKNGDYAIAIGTNEEPSWQNYFQSIAGITQVKLQSIDWYQAVAYTLLFFIFWIILNNLIFNLFKSREKRKGLFAVLFNLLIAVMTVITCIATVTRPPTVINPPTTNVVATPTTQSTTSQKSPLIKLQSPQPGQLFSENNVTVQFTVENFTLLLDEQSIGLTVDNNPPIFFSAAVHTIENLDPGFHSIAAFLVDKDKKIIKSAQPAVISYFYSGDKRTDRKIDLTKPTLLTDTGAQKHTITSDDLEKNGFWIDLATLNAFIDKDAYRIQYAIDEKTPIQLPDNSGILIKSKLETGKHLIKISIIDQQNATAEGEFASQVLELEIAKSAAVESPTNTTTPAITPVATNTPTA